MSDSKRDGLNFSVGNIQNSTGIVIGNESSVSVNQTVPSMHVEVIVQLDEFIRSLGSYGNSLTDAHDIRECAAAARAEAAEPTPRWHVVSRLLKRIAASVASVAALTEAISNIQTLIAHIAS